MTIPAAARIEDIFDYKGLAAYLKVSHGTLRRWVMESRIPFIKVGSHVRFHKDDIRAWLRTNTVFADCGPSGAIDAVPLAEAFVAEVEA
jgi:excisionase family DNA binding protein